MQTTLRDLYISFFRIGLFTFGGGLAAIPIIEKEVCEKRKWTSEQEMLDYYAVSQTTPGVIMVNIATFIGHQERGLIGAVVATLGVITPSLIIISVIAKLVQNFADIKAVKSAIKGIGAGICAIILSSLIKLAKKQIKNITGLVLCVLAFIIAYFTDISIVWVTVMAIAVGLFVNRKGLKK